mmetsp:Transcript_14305/g.36419  ORF Transcript_14305/g.36419 Transcript_14305/m.36419 type:complete len:205 (-) Transcript_14305:341-955(-)|eukprot:CAMPEP_0113879802 /NCGR_PEP_ID=MMETSP0780_2-20120614/7434_1 /TAXON_ID=652834 /ORGANISM="Palpitomonas bilix" /LENGTH=204 /DNA_ID=CAMNT_0000866411 /DNA_START=239 /DNA_END=853 /DNA_ORIENTATION=- /assembly_acc=CAM_ASM_000599
MSTQPETTLAMIKPNAVKDSNVDAIINRIKEAGFTIRQRRDLTLDRSTAEQFYAEHKGKAFFEALTNFMTSGPIVALALSREDAIKGWRDLMGPTNPKVAREESPNCLRALYGATDESVLPTQNATHGSDSPASAEREVKFFFPNLLSDSLPISSEAWKAVEEELGSILTEGLTSLCKEKPAQPVRWLGEWLIRNNPKAARPVN